MSTTKMVEVELDDVSYQMFYQMHRYCPETYWEPASGGLEIESVYIVLPVYKGEPVSIRVDRHSELRALDRLIDAAYQEAKEESEAA